MEKYRKDFERWATAKRLKLRREYDSYYWGRVALCWEAWKACASSLCPEDPQDSKDVKNVNNDNKEVVTKIFEFWKLRMGKVKAKLSVERVKCIRARLADGYTISDICTAIENCSMSDFHMGKNNSSRCYNDITLICRNGSKLESFRDMTIPAQREQSIKSRSISENLNDRDWAK